MTTHVSCRLPRDLGERVDAAATAESTVRSDIVRRAIRHYLEEDPDGVSLRPTNSEKDRSRPRRENGRTPGSKKPVYDPSRDLDLNLSG
ncbi:CopG family ribbon-helix-helix protein [Halolamina litorea]|uniref:CopG family ribbon-helix-helix protein n=1 Tax=Halolamina litorea TaxID=1515593 RepID=A0ABD6BLQ0_9EURY